MSPSDQPPNNRTHYARSKLLFGAAQWQVTP